MHLGNKKIYHLEAWVVKVMSLYKVNLLPTRQPWEVVPDLMSPAFRLRYRYDRV